MTEKKTTRNVLVVEDEPINQKVMTLMLEGAGCAVQLANCGEEAIALMTPDIHLIFMDIRLPDMTGIEVAQVIRKSYTDVPIVAATAHGQKGDHDMYLSAGMNEVVVKPFSQQQIKDLVAKWCH